MIEITRGEVTVTKYKKTFKTLAILSISMFIFVVMIACSNSETTGSSEDNDDSDRLELRIMTTLHNPEAPEAGNRVEEAIEDLTNTSLVMNWVPATNYDEQFNIALASGDLPHIMLTESKGPSFINAARDGAFWDLTDYVDDYEYLSQMNDLVKNNSSIDGRIYGIYRSRDLGRQGVTIRKDWLENVGLEIPETIDDFYNVLKAFTFDDPNESGEDDTVGMVASSHEGAWDVMQTWFGAPNKWGYDENEDLQPDFLTDEYREALHFFKGMYEEGLVNEDFAVMDPADLNGVLQRGEAGLGQTVVDEAARIQEDMPDPEDVVFDVFGAVKGSKGHFNLPTAGYGGMLAISTSAVETEEELRRVLEFLDQLNTEEAQILAFNGIEGIHYEINDGEYDNLAQHDESLMYEHVPYNQILQFIPEGKEYRVTATELREKQAEVMLDNEDIVVGNPAEPLISEVYGDRGSQLDNIIADARIQYIVGQIDESGLDEAIALWKRSGGDEYIEEINQLYQESLDAE